MSAKVVDQGSSDANRNLCICFASAKGWRKRRKMVWSKLENIQYNVGNDFEGLFLHQDLSMNLALYVHLPGLGTHDAQSFGLDLGCASGEDL